MLAVSNAELWIRGKEGDADSVLCFYNNCVRILLQIDYYI